MNSPLKGQFQGHVVSYFHLDLNDKGRQGKKGWGVPRFLTGCMQEGGGGHSKAYSVQQGWGGGGSKQNRDKMRI